MSVIYIYRKKHISSRRMAMADADSPPRKSMWIVVATVEDSG